MNTQEITEHIRTYACKLGFTACGFAKAEELIQEKEKLKTSVNSGFLGDMHFMEKNIEKRANPLLLLDNAKTIISVLLSYSPGNIKILSDYKISAYAWGNDYHKIMLQLLEKLFQKIKELFTGVKGRAFCDSAPVFERAWAKRAGIGWIGKNNLLINPIAGSFVFIGEIIIDRELKYDSPIKEQCINCSLCIENCPTRTLAPYTLDARKCISYITVENKSEKIPDVFAGKIKNEIYGCDICQSICPHNKGIDKGLNHFFAPGEYVKWKNENWETLDETRFQKVFAETAIIRTGFKRVKRNVEFVKVRK